MPLTRDSVLHAWDLRAKPLPNPIIGGDPVFTRDSARTFIGADGKVRSAIVDTAPLEFELIDGLYQPVMPLQPARTNLVLHSEDIANAAWVKTGASIGNVTSDVADYAGLSFSRIAGLSTGTVYQDVTVTGDGVKAYSVFLHSDGSAGTLTLRVLDATTVTYKAVIDVTVAADGSMSATASVGTLLDTEQLADGVYRFLIQTTALIAANANRFYAAFGGGTATTILSAGIQAENGAFPTSYMATTTAAATRAADSFYWNAAPTPQATVIYGRLVKGFTNDGGLSAGRVMMVADAAGNTPLMQAYFGNTGASDFAFQYYGSASSVASCTAASSHGDEFEYAGVIHSDGKARVIASVEGGAAVSGVGPVPAGGIVAAWSGARIWLGEHPIAAFGSHKHQTLLMLKLADMTNQPGTASDEAVLDELRAFRLDAAGRVAA